MEKIAGTYQLEKTENLEEYLCTFGFSENQAKTSSLHKPKLEVTVDGENIVMNREYGSKNILTIYTLGKEVDETMPDPFNITIKSLATLKGNSLSVTSRNPQGKVNKRMFQFSDDGLVVTLNGEECLPIAKIIYKKI